MTSGAGKGSDNRRPGTQAQRPPCLVRQLAEPRLHGLAPGLCEKDGLLAIDKAVWGCCAGSGFREVLAPKGGSPSTMVSCDLAHRLRLAQDIHAQFLKLYPDSPLSLSVSAKILAPYLERLCLIAKGASHLGLCAVAPETSQGHLQGAKGSDHPASLWQVALMAAWRFGLKGHVVDLSRSESGRLLPVPGKGAPAILFVDQVDRLWDPVAAERFELVVQYAYNAMVPLFVNVVPLSQPQEKGVFSAKTTASTSLKGAFSARIAKAKSNLALSALSPDCQPKLRSTTSGVDMWLRGPIANREKS